MPYRIRWEGHGVYRRFFGVLTLAEFKDAYEEMCSDVRYEGIRYIISDYLEGQPGPDFTEQDLTAFAELERLRYYDSPDTVQAIVATDPKIVWLTSSTTNRSASRRAAWRISPPSPRLGAGLPAIRGGGGGSQRRATRY